MTYYGSKDLAAAYRTVRNNTIQIAEEIPEESYDFRASGESRTIAQTLTHIAISTAFQTHVHQNHLDSLTKVNFPELVSRLTAEENKPRSKAEIIALLKSEGEKYAEYLESLPESFLAEPVGMMPGANPPAKSRFEMLMSAKEHEMHHRGQLMVYQRLLGQTPHLTRQTRERNARAAAAAAAAPQPVR